MSIESLKFSSVQTVRDLIIYAKNTYTPDDIKDYLNKLINEDNFKDIASLIIDPSGKSEEDMLYYDAVLILLYLEAITIAEAKTYVKDLSGNKDNIINLLIIEMGYASVDNKIVKRKLKVIDHIPRVYYGRKDVLSYKDKENISNETIRLLTDYKTDKTGFNKYTATLNDLLPVSDTDIIEDFSDIFMSVNNKKAIIEDYIPTISLILNEINISGTDVESSIIDNAGNKIKVTFNHAKPSDDYSYIKTLLENIMQRTINYN